jgi:hypothetical protein
MKNGAKIDFAMDSGLAVLRRPDGTFLIEETGDRTEN